jgi:hypothetical protein
MQRISSITALGADSTSAAIAVAAERVAGIVGAVRRDETLISVGPMTGCWVLTWLSDDVQLAGVADGVVDEPDDFESFHNRVYLLRGDAPEFGIERVPNYPNMILRAWESDFASYWGGSILAVDGVVYRLLPTSNHPYLREDKSFWPGFRMNFAAKLIYSPDGGATWNNHDGSSPVVWENWDDRSLDNMLFFDEYHPGLSTGGSFLQMGKNYSLNADGYVYAYFDMADPVDLGVYRTPRDRVRDRRSYEFFTGCHSDGTATWSSDLMDAAALHRFPPGWIATKDDEGMAPAGWSVTVTYNPALGVYLLAGQGMGVSDEGGWFAKPGYLGFWAGPTPWGPFSQFYEDPAWTTAGDEHSRAFGPQIPSKWISSDGRSFWLTWSDAGIQGVERDVYNADADWLAASKDITSEAEYIQTFADFTRGHCPHTKLNAQRVDLITR